MESTVRQRRSGNQSKSHLVDALFSFLGLTFLVHDVLGFETRQVTSPRPRNPLPGAVQVERYRGNMSLPCHGSSETILTSQLDQELSQTIGDCEQGHVTADPTNQSRRDWMVADFIASDSSLFVYRRFGVLITRRLVMLQLELSRLERQWKLLDRQIRTRPNNDEAEDFELETRLHDLLADIDQKSDRYRTAFSPSSKFFVLMWNRKGSASPIPNMCIGKR